MDIKNTKEVVDLGLAAAELYKKASDDGKIDFSDASLLIGLPSVVVPAIEDITSIPQEIADLSADEAKELVEHVVTKLGVTDEKALKIVNGAIKIGTGVLEVIQAV